VGAERHQGAVARVRAAETTVEAILGAPGGVVVACGVQDPGNLGGLLRVAAAAGAGGLVAADGSADPWNPKAVRASAGAVFHLPVARRGDVAAILAGAGPRVRRAAVARGGLRFTEVDWRRPFLLLLGGEGGGLPAALLEAADERVTIPMAGGVESLNVLAAATLLLFEAARPDRRGDAKRA
jgi:TrmH family RNA methyltransferase